MDSQKLKVVVGAELLKAKVVKRLDAVVVERDHLLDHLTTAKSEYDAILYKTLHWEVRYKAQVGYINHLAFMLSPHIDKPPAKLAAKIRSMPSDIGVIIQAANCHALMVTPVKESTLPTDGVNDQDDTLTAR